MKMAALVLGFGLATGAAAQDCFITISPFSGTISISYQGALPVQQLWSDISIRLSGDAPITITSQSNVYTSVLTPGGAQITGNGTNIVEFVGAAPGALLGAQVNSSDPFSPFTFSYAGTFGGFGVSLFSQNTCTFVLPPFGNPINMVNANGSLGPLTWRLDPNFPPAAVSPGTAALLGFAGVIGARRRR